MVENPKQCYSPLRKNKLQRRTSTKQNNKNKPNKLYCTFHA